MHETREMHPQNVSTFDTGRTRGPFEIVLHHASVYKNAGNFCDGRAASSDELAADEDEAAELYKYFTASSFFASLKLTKAF